MKKLFNRVFDRLSVKRSVYDKKPYPGDVVILCKSTDKEALYYEVIEALLGSDTVVSYRYFGGVSVYVIIPQSLYECLHPADVKETLLSIYDNFSDVFNIKLMVLNYTTDYGEVLFYRLMGMASEGEEFIVNCT